MLFCIYRKEDRFTLSVVEGQISPIQWVDIFDGFSRFFVENLRTKNQLCYKK